MFFIIQKRHEVESGRWQNAVITKTTEDEALLQVYGYMFTYSHGKGDPALDYVSCQIENLDGRVIKREIDNRMGQTEAAKTEEE
jgi:hypothetical protein